MARKLGTWAPGSPEWSAARAGRVGGTEVAPNSGWSPFKTRKELLAEKIAGPVKTALTPAMDRGNRLEDSIISWLLNRHGLDLNPSDSAATWVDDDDDRLIYNPDGITFTHPGGRRVLLEAKTVADRCEERGWGRAGTDLVPLHYQAQVMWGMGLLGITRCHIGVLHGATNGRPDLAFSTYTINFSQPAFSFIKRRVLDFLDDLESKQRGMTI